jgi:hypothetical protein
MCLTLRPFLHLGQNLAGAQERSRCSPQRRNDLDRAEHRHTINTAGTAAPNRAEEDQDEAGDGAVSPEIRWQLPTTGRLAAPFDRPRIFKSSPLTPRERS